MITGRALSTSNAPANDDRAQEPKGADLGVSPPSDNGRAGARMGRRTDQGAHSSGASGNDLRSRSRQPISVRLLLWPANKPDIRSSGSPAPPASGRGGLLHLS